MNPTADHYLYRLYDAGGSLLYIGCSSDVARRLKSHRSTQPWWLEVAAYDSEGPYRRLDGLRREQSAIFCEHPRYNRQHNPVPPARREFDEDFIAYMIHMAGGVPRIYVIQALWVGWLENTGDLRHDFKRWL